jgi:penicillin-binding protein 1A
LIFADTLDRGRFAAYNVIMTKPASRTASDNRNANRSRSRYARNRSSRKKRIKTACALILLFAESAIAVFLVSAVVVFWKFSNDLPTIEDLRQDVRPPVATTIWSEDGVQLGKLQVINRQPVSLKEIPKSLVNATVAIEDRRFFEHPGVDVQGIARAALANVTGSNATRQGASTLTQQLVRNVGHFGLDKKKSFARKIREALTALRLEQLYSKNEIISLYLNNIYYGSGAYGVQAASRTYFGKSASKLDLAESAMIAGLAQRPSSFTPFEHPKAAIKRRDEVLDNLFKYHYITQAEMDMAKSEKLRLMPPQKRKDYDFKAPYFVWYVLSDLIRRYGTDYVYHGLRIETTLNWKMQQMAEQELESGLRNHSDDGSGPNQGALVSLDNNTGYIRALVGGRNYRASQYNNITMGRRQPGSTFKVFDYSAAFDTEKCDLNTTFMDKPIPYPNDPKKIVKNFSEEGGYSYREINCKTAIQFSKNTIAVQVADAVGINTVIDYAHKMGITSRLQPVLPTALGASEVHPLDLASAYTVFPLKGSRYQPMPLVRVMDQDGNIVEEHSPEIHTEILKKHTVEQMDEALEAVVTKGTGTLAREDSAGNIVENARGKTGTTSDSRDAWFAGYTPELTTVIWVAQVHHYNQKHPLLPTYMPMGGVTGGHVCAPIWHDFMMKAVPEERKFRVPGIQMIATAPAPSVMKPEETALPVRRKRRHGDAKPTDSQPKPNDNTANPVANPDGSTPLPEGDNQNIQNPDVGRAIPVTLPTAPPKQTSAPMTNLKPVVITNAVPHPQSSPIRTTPVPPLRGESTITQARIAPPRLETVRAAPRPAPPEMVDVSICVDSGERATPWCTAVHIAHMTRKEAGRLRRCRVHKPPLGEG